MAHITADRVRETTVTAGTGAITLDGAVIGFRSFSSVLSTNDTCYYAIAALPGFEWEVGIGTYSALNTLTRTTILSSSNAGAAVVFPAGSKEIFITAAAGRFLQADAAGNYGNFSAGTITASLTGNASTATTLQTARTINGTSFNGSANITVTAAANTLTGTTLASGVTASSLTSVGTLGSLAVSGVTTSAGGVRYGSAHFHPTYKINLDFGADVAGTWRKIITVALQGSPATYSTHGFKITITDPNANHATQGSVSVDEVVYYVACVRTEATTIDTPDLCIVRGPAQHVRAVKTATGNYEIQVQPEFQYREYFITIDTYATNGSHTITYENGSVAGSAGIATYTASVGNSILWAEKIQAASTITGTQLISNVATGTAPLAVTSTTKVTNLNADLLDGFSADTANTASTVVARDASGNFSAGTITAALTGNASTATTLATGRTIAITGDISYTSPSFNGSANVTAAATLANSGVTAGSYGGNNSIPTITVDAKGRVTGASTTTPSGTWAISVSGNAATATTLATARNIGGVSFNGSVDINLPGVNTAGNQNTTGTAANVTGTVAVANGGTGSTTASGALTNLGAMASTATTFSGDSTSKDDMTTRTDSGFYQSNTGTTAEGWPINNTSWQHLIACTHTNDANYYSMQLAADFYANDFYYRSTNGSGTTAWSKVLLSTNYTSYAMPAGSSATNSVDVRAPVFYDSNDTGFYIDPNSTSRIRKTNLISSGAGWDDGLNIYSSDATNRWNFLTDSGASNVLRIAYNTSEAIQINTSRNVTANVDIRSPIFYDSANTGYYTDPASTSRMGAISLNTVAVTAGITSLTSAPLTTQYADAATTNTWYPMTYQRAQHSGGYVTHLNTGLYKTTSGWGSGSSGWYAAIGGNDSYPTQAWYLTYDGYIQNSLGYVYTSGSFRAPIFYDSDNTGYYLDPNSTTSLRTVGSWRADSSAWDGEFSGKIQYHSSHWYIQGAGELIYRNSGGANVFTVNQSGVAIASNDFRAPAYYDSADTGYYWNPNTSSAHRFQTPSGYYDAGPQNASWCHHYTDRQGHYWNVYGENPASWRAPVFYDSNDTGYYFDGASTSKWNESNQNGWHTFNNYGLGVTGSYDSTRLQTVFAMGSSYRMAADGLSTSNMYGLAWSHPNAGTLGGANNLNDHGLLIINNGGFRAAISSRAVFSADVRGTLFYDYNDTGYYCDPNSTSQFSRVNANNMFYGDGNWSYFTGFYDTNDTAWYIDPNGTSLTNDFRANIFYDRYDTAYYAQPRSVSHFNDHRVNILYDRNDTDGVIDPVGHSRLKYAGHASDGNVSALEIKNTGGTGDGDVAAISWHCAGHWGLQMHLRADGYFGIGGWSASSWRWYSNTTNGDMTAAGNVTAYSDPRLKEEVTPIADALEKVKQLNGVHFRWKDISELGKPGSYDYGVLATDVEKIAPELVCESAITSPDGDRYKTVAYDKLTPFLIEAIKEQQAIIDSQESRIAKLESLINSLINKE